MGRKATFALAGTLCRRGRFTIWGNLRQLGKSEEANAAVSNNSLLERAIEGTRREALVSPTLPNDPRPSDRGGRRGPCAGAAGRGRRRLGSMGRDARRGSLQRLDAVIGVEGAETRSGIVERVLQLSL